MLVILKVAVAASFFSLLKWWAHMKSLWIRNTLLLAALLLAGCGDGNDLDMNSPTDDDRSDHGNVFHADDPTTSVPLDAVSTRELIEKMKAADGISDTASKTLTDTVSQKIYFVDPKTGRRGKNVQVERTVKKFSDNNLVVDGPYQEFYPGGEKFLLGEFQDELRVGTWTFWHRNGEVAKVVNYKNGEEEGSVTVFRADGTKELERSYKAGKKDGKWFSFDKTGENPTAQQEYRDDVLHGSSIGWYKSGKPREEIQRKNGKIDGTVTRWHENGQISHRTEFKAGKRHGLDTIYSASGQKIREIRYEQNKVVPNLAP